MSKHRDEFSLPLTVQECLHLCNAAVRALGWSVVEQGGQYLACTEGAYRMGSITYPAKVQIHLAGDAPGFTRVIFDGSIFGIGPIQSGHLKQKMQQLRGVVTQYAAQGAAAQADQTNPPAQGAAPPAAATARSVFINGVQLSDDQLRALEQMSYSQVPDGSYWYDRVSGAWGLQGGPAAGLTLAGLDLGGPLRPDASDGNTGVFINGRELHYMDLLGLQQLVPYVTPGRYWVDAQGNAGVEGGPALANLRVLAQAAAANQGGGVWRIYGDGSGAYRNSNVGIGLVNDGEGGMLITN